MARSPEVIRRDTLCASLNVLFLFVLTQKVLEKFNMKDAEARCQPFGDHFKLSKKQVPKTEAGKELVWLKNFLKELDRVQIECILFCDNHSAIHLAKNLVFHGRMNHVKIRYHYIRELMSEGTLSLKKILGAKNHADMLTKVVTTGKLKLCATSTGL
ncbi:hypothetical protein Tco_0521033 [Tanacetum coccineum]